MAHRKIGDRRWHIGLRVHSHSVERAILGGLSGCKSEFGIDLGPSSGPRDVLAAELGMLKCLVQLGRAAMQRWCQQLGDGDRGSRATKDGVPYKRPKTSGADG